MIAADIGDGLLQRFHHLGICRFFRRVELFLAHEKFFRRKFGMVEELRVLHDRCVALPPHILNDARRHLTGGEVGTKELSIPLPHGRTKFHFVEGRLLEKPPNLFFPRVFHIHDSHRFLYPFSKIVRITSTNG